MKRRDRIDYNFLPLHRNFCEHWLPQLKLQEIRVYLALLQLTRGFGKSRNAASYAQIGQISGLAVRNLRPVILRLEGWGLITVTRMGTRPNIYSTNGPWYSLDLPALNQCKATPPALHRINAPAPALNQCTTKEYRESTATSPATEVVP
jgi:hypothetical protein